MISHSLMRRTLPLALTGFFNAFNDSGFKLWAVLAVLGSRFDYFRDSAFLLSVAAVCILPPLLLPLWSGYVADRLPKRYVVIAVQLLELPLMSFSILAVSRLGAVQDDIWILTALLLHSILGAFYAPAFDCLLGETFSEPELSRSCGRITFASALGIIAGIIVISAAFYFQTCGYVMICSVVLGIISAVRIFPVVSPVQGRRELVYPCGKTLKKGCEALRYRTGILAAALGDVCFMGLGVAAIPLLVLFGRYSLGMVSNVNITLLQLFPVAGFMIGCLCAGGISGSKIELGLVPLGALGMVIALPLMVFLPGEGKRIVVNIPGGMTADMFIYAGVCFWAAFAGFSGGILSIPLRAFVLQRLKPELRGAALALKNAVAFFIGSLAMLLAVSCALGGGSVKGLPPLLAEITAVMPRIPFQVLLVGFGLAVFLITALTMWSMPNFMLRFIILALRHSFYKLKISGAENNPERGGALLLSNHVSAVDSILISACTSRQIRFLLYEDYFSLPLLGAVARMTGFFKVPSAGKAKSLGVLLENVRSHIENGGLVCVFPEGRLTTNGLVGEFKPGYERMLPANADIPIIPVNISFAWGNVFSNFFTRPGLRKKFSFPFFSAVTFGKPLPRNATAFEIRQRIVELGAEAAESALPGEVTLHHAAVRLAGKYPLRKLFADHDGREYSAFHLVRDAALLSRYIRRTVPFETQYVGTLLPNSTAAFKAILAILLADKTPVPLNYSTSQAVFDCSVKKAGISLILTNAEFLKKIRISPGDKGVYVEDLEKEFSLAGRILMRLGLFLLPSGEFMNMLSPLSAFDLERDAVVLFSSGSTGNPKGVRLSHHNLNSNARSVASGLAACGSDHIVGNLPLFHSFGLNVCFWMPVMRGIPVTYIANPLDSAGVRKIISGRKATMLFATPSFLQKYLQRCTGEELASLRLIATGAEKLRADIAEKVKTLTEGRLEIIECYGCTELSPVVSINLARDVAQNGSAAGCHDSIGLPLENISVRILDPLNFTPVDPGEEGILCVKGSLVMRGYLNDEDLTREVMAGEYYKTGDIARMDKSGYLHICGRLSRFSKIAGEMVPHEMVERIINEICACETRVVAVCGIPDPVKGEALLVLYTPEMPLTPEQVVDQLRERSISNLWIPKAVNFHRVDQLPLLGSGKLDLALLRRTAESFVSDC
ncbi:MAG: MFS transporter [Lentisphaeria bacterium]|nr:MFS transporter [Lentisphaeria bacterium]